MGNVNMEASQIHYRGGNRPMSVEEAIKEGGGGASNASIAPEFSETAQYMMGDLVFYEGVLYRFEEDHDPGAWDSTQVMGTNISENMVMLPGDGLQRIIHELVVKLKADGGLHFDANGAIYADHLPYYRLTEHDTKQQWIDGSPVYSITLHFVEESEQVRKSYTTEISALSIATLIDLKAIVKLGATGNNEWYTAPFWYDNTKQLTVSGTNNMLNIYSDGWKFTEAYVTLYYTKTA